MNKSENNVAVVTGIGILSPIGNDCAEVLSSLRTLRDGIAEATKIDVSCFASHINAEVKNVDFSSRMTTEELKTFTDPYLRLAICSARDAIRNSGADVSGNDVAMVVATCNAGMNSQEAEYKSMFSDIEFSREISLQGEFYAIARTLASTLNIGGGCFVINTACSGSTAAIAISQMLINQGKYKTVLVGGADAMSIANYAGFSALKVVSSQKTAPFSTPIGMNIGEGTAFWVVENFSQAKARNANILGKVIGHATTGDAHHPTQPDPRGDGAYRTMRNALLHSGVSLDDIACINAHASGTSANDKAEAKAIAKFSQDKYIPFTSTKSYTGHCMGATGIIEATCQLLSMNDNFIPPTLHFQGVRDGCEVAPVAFSGIEKEYDCFLSANYAFAGNNAAIVIAKERFEKFETKACDTSSIAITGIGMISSLGIGTAQTVDALHSGKVGVDDVTRFECSNKAGCVKLPPLRTLNRRIDFSGMNNISVFATVAASQALDNAGIRMRRDMSEMVGLIGSVSRGSSEEAHMLGVFNDSLRRGDIGCFSNVTANSTAGWVSKALEIKGANITFTSGLNSGIQTLEYAQMLLRGNEAKYLVAFAADELYAQQMKSYSDFGYLRSDATENDFKMKYYSAYKTVFGEGSCAFMLERTDNAKERNANIFGEVLASVSTMDGGDFYNANLDGDGLYRAFKIAIKQAGISATDIDVVSWSPRGTAQDSKIINLRDSLMAKVPLVTSVFHTGYAETMSSLQSLGCLLYSLKNDNGLWTQRFGIDFFDNVECKEQPKIVASLASSHTGGNYVSIIKVAD